MMRRGFSVIELLVTIAIISIMSAIVFYNSPKLNRTIYLNRAAREVAFALRTAQARAVQIKTLPGVASAPTNFSIEFNQNSTSFRIFSDGIDGGACANGILDTAGCGLERNAANQTLYQMQNGMRITGLRVPAPPANPPAPPITVSNLNIMFYRPDPTTKATKGNMIGNPSNCYALSTSTDCSNGANGPFEIDVELASDSSFRKTIQVWLTGQISVR